MTRCLIRDTASCECRHLSRAQRSLSDRGQSGGLDTERIQKRTVGVSAGRLPEVAARSPRIYRGIRARISGLNGVSKTTQPEGPVARPHNLSNRVQRMEDIDLDKGRTSTKSRQITSAAAPKWSSRATCCSRNLANFLSFSRSHSPSTLLSPRICLHASRKGGNDVKQRPGTEQPLLTGTDPVVGYLQWKFRNSLSDIMDYAPGTRGPRARNRRAVPRRPRLSLGG